MFRSIKSFARLGLFVVLLAGLGASVLAAQARPRPWTLAATFTGLRVGGASGMLYGPELGIRRDFARADSIPRWGVQLRASLPVLDADCCTDDGAGAIDLGPTLTFAGERGELGLEAGATAFLVGDSGELLDGGIGAFIGGHGTTWLGSNVGAVLGANVRVSSGGNTYPSVSAGLALRF